MIYILDANAIIATIRKEQGADIVITAIDDPSNSCFIHSVNLCEVFYGFRRDFGESKAQNIIQDILSTGIIPREDMDFNFWQQAGRYKADLRRISLADCFCLALANRLDGTVLTSDHHEFDIVASRNLAQVEFFR